MARGAHGGHPGQPVDPRAAQLGDGMADEALRRMAAQARVLEEVAAATPTSLVFELHPNWTVKNLSAAVLGGFVEMDAEAAERVGARLIAIDLPDRTIFLVTSREHREALADTILNDGDDDAPPADPAG